MPRPASQAKFAFAFILLSNSIIACSSSSKTSQPELESLLKTRLGTHYTISYNTSNSYALCRQSRTDDHANRSFKYLVVKISDRTVTHEGSFKNGYVKWVDDKSIEVGTSGMDEKIDKKVIPVEGQKS
jgi:hypothetical protein